MGGVSHKWIGTDGFEVKSETTRFTVVCPRCSENPKSFYVVVLTSAGEKCSKMRPARAARSLWFF